MRTYNEISDEDIYSDHTDSEEDSITEVSYKKNTHESKEASKITVNVMNTQYSLIKKVLQETFRYRIITSSSEEWDLMWIDTGVSLETFSKMKTYQKVNHFPSMKCLSRKDNLAKNLMRMRKYFPEKYNFFPLTWHLPNDYNDFREQLAQNRGKTYIVKPEAMSQGRGIYLTKSPEDVDIGERRVVQRYINDPYLIEGLKFDLRLYVLIYGCDPLRIYLYNEGLARLATEEYEQPSKYNIKNMYIHLTNYAINKNNDNFIFNTDEDETDTGHKRSLDFIWRYIDSHGGNSKQLQYKIKDLIIKTFCAVQPQLAQPYRTSQPNSIENNMCFEILGFDVLIDSNLNPWLLEVNHSPSFSTDTPFDHKVKEELIYDTIKLIHLDHNSKVMYRQQRNIEFKSRALGRTVHKMTKEKKEELKKRAMEVRDEYELKNLGGYARIYPDIEDKYEELISLAEKIWEDVHGYKRHLTPRISLKKTPTMQKGSLIIEKPTTKNIRRLARTNTRAPIKRELRRDSYKEVKQTIEDHIESIDKSLFSKVKGISYITYSEWSNIKKIQII